MDLIQKLNSESRQLEAIKFVHALDLFDKYPPVSLLEAYLRESRKAERGNNSSQSQNEAISKELAAVKAVTKTVEECKLESEFSCEDLQKHITRLEQQKADKKRTARAATATVRASPRNLSQALYDAALPSIPGTIELSGKPSPRSYLYPSEFHASSGFYDRPASYGGYPMAGLGTGYGSSFYPLGYQK
ncbi:FRIGIDA-like protein 4a [Musa acuminata AAA Group]|uniref:FRIGIDA-like protein 4a n=1 Tax=Musa acuminata AAA Group TaxID=214697 RepID=UPI0031E1C7BB